jgi:cephalosporin hydroxylase
MERGEDEVTVLTVLVYVSGHVYVSAIVRFQVLKAVKITAFWNIAPCTVVEVGRRFGGSYCLYHQSDGGGGKHLCNASQLLQDYAK